MKKYKNCKSPTFFFKNGVLAFFSAALLMTPPAPIVTRFETGRKLAALTFDACPAGPHSAFDRKVLDYLVSNKIPFTLFLSGSFIRKNIAPLKELSKLDFVEMENHSYLHLHLKGVEPQKVDSNVLRNGSLIKKVSGRQPVFFRFPYGEYDDSSLAEVERLGYTVVHWTFESGDPNERLSREGLIKRVIARTRPGSILIFHINGNGRHTGEAIGEIVDRLKAKGYQFVLLKDIISKQARPAVLTQEKNSALSVHRGP